MTLGLKVAPHHISWSDLRSAAVFADESGLYDHFWHFDHFYPITGDTDGPCLEAWVTLSALAEATSRIRLGCMVNGVHHRHPAVTANMASALDIVSAGRFELGIGCGWNEQESGAYGLTLGSIAERLDRLDEALEIIVSMLGEEVTSFHGRFYDITDARNEPKGPQQPLPICVGGAGERRTLRTVARFASHWNLPMYDPDTFGHKRGVLAAHCADMGTDPASITVSSHVFVPAGADLGRIEHEVAAQEAAGIDQVIVYFQPPFELAELETVTARLDDLDTTGPGCG